MPSIKDLTAEDLERIRSEVARGAQLDDLQRLLREEFQISATYMETRFMALDQGLEFISEAEEEESVAEPILEEVENTAPGRVSVTIDSITRAGAAISGSVVFSDGEKALWLIDQMGRPALDPDTPGYQPSEPDLVDFQNELRAALEG